MEQSDNTEKKSDIKKNIVVFLFTILICFIILEISVRQLGKYDEDGQFSFRGYGFKPYILPYNSLVNLKEKYKQLEDPFFLPDPYLGWDIAKNGKHPNKLDYSNSNGIRSYRDNPKEFSLEKNDNVLRIAAFGDSYIFGSDILYEESWAHYLDKFFLDNAEVINFGVGGYGNDQAYLKWKIEGKKFSPDIVLIGFQAENCRRNFYIIRKMYDRKSELPFFKPRFILENNLLKLVNYPVEDYLKLPEIVRDFNNSSLAKYEYFYNEDDYKVTSLIQYSKFLSLFPVFFNDFIGYEKRHFDYYNVNNSEMQLCYEIIKMFVKEASADSKVYLIHIPKREDIEQKLNSKKYFYEDFLIKLKKEFTVIDPANRFIEISKNKSIDYVFKGHYTKEGNYILAEVIFDFISKDIATRIKFIKYRK